MGMLVLVRHGRSVWNEENRFAGWVDIPLAHSGEVEARSAGKLLRNVVFGAAFTSKLVRARRTLEPLLEEAGQAPPIFESAALNERHYGMLQGMNREVAIEQFGAAQVHEWRRSYAVAPPGGESLRDAALRVLPYFEKWVVPVLAFGQNALVVAHGNSLRAILMKIRGLTPLQVESVEVQTGAPLAFYYERGAYTSVEFPR